MMNRILTTAVLSLALLTGCTVNVAGPSATPTSASTTSSTSTTTTSSATPATTGGDEQQAGDLKVVGFKFSDSKEGAAREDKTFRSDEVVYLLFEVQGFKMDEGKNVWVQEDLTVTNPEGKPIVQKENLVDLKAPNPNDEKTVNFDNDVTLENAVAGTYKVNITIRDKQGNQTIQHEDTFEVTVEE